MGLKFRRGTTAQKSGSLAFGEPYVNTDLGTLQIGGAAGDITLGASGTGSAATFAGISGSSLDITGNAKIDGNLTLGGNITIGDNTSDTVAMTANLSSSIIPSLTNTFDLGSPSKQWRHLYISTGSLYMNGTPILSSTANELQLTTDTGQSLKLLETSADTITLQTADGNLTFASSGGGDIVLDPTTGVISLKGTVQVQDGNKITSSGGNAIQFGNNVAITGSLITTTGLTVGGDFVVNGTTTTIDSTNINIGDNIIVLNGTLTTNGGMYVKDAAGASTLTGSMLWDTTNDKWIAGAKGSELAILRVGGDSVVSSSTQIPALLPTGVVSGSSQTIANLPTGTVSGSSQITYASISSIPGGIVSGSSQVTPLLPTGVVSGSSQVTGIGNAQLTNSSTTIGTTAIALGASATTIAGLTSVTSTGFTGALTGNASTATTLATARTINGTSFNGSADITIPSLVSGSAQITLSSTTGYGSVLNQAVLTSSSPTFAGLTINGAITATGDITAYYTSDKRHKNNIQTIPNALEKVTKLNGVTWEWNDDVHEVTKSTPKTGLIAQEVQEVLPEVIKEREDGFLALDYSKMMGLMVEAMKEQQTQIEKLRMDLDNYECKCDNCKSK